MLLSSLNNNRDKAFLVGNGLNRVGNDNTNSWPELLKNLAQRFNVQLDFQNEFKPFPLLFEEILHRMEGGLEGNLARLKEQISLSLNGLQPTDLHVELINLGIGDILTTNYDYSIEKVLNGSFSNEKGQTQKGSTDETLNSIRRRCIFKDSLIPTEFSVRNLNVWHIHGEINQRLSPSKESRTSRSNSIMLGHEHYGQYLSEIQKYLKGDKPGVGRITERWGNQGFKRHSWIDFFFFGELHIAGFGFDFSENHLWWLLNHRAELLRRGKLSHHLKNRIVFYYHETEDVFPKSPTTYVTELQKKKMNQAKIDLFEALQVETVKIETELGDYANYYKKVFEKVKEPASFVHV